MSPLRPGATEEAPLVALAPLRGARISSRLVLVRNDGRCAVMLGATPLHVWDDDDRIGKRVAAVSVVTAGQATRRDVAAAWGMHENTVQRWVHEGLGAVVPAKSGPKGPSKMTATVRRKIEEARSRGLSGGEIQRRLLDDHGVRVSRSSVFGVIHELRTAQTQQTGFEMLVEAPREEHAEGAPVITTGEMTGAGMDAPVVLPCADQGRYMGLALYYPALAAIGLLSVARDTLRLRVSERFGVRAVVLTLCFLSLLRKSTLESAKHLRRWEFGAVVGSERAPCVKTLRRKLAELEPQQQSAAFGLALAQHWVANAVVGTAHLYVDGHVKVYSGKRRLQEAWNPQRRMPLPGVVSYFVGDQQGRPLLVVNDEVSPSLSKSLPRVVRGIREVTGVRPLTLIFDRGGYDGKLFAWLHEQGIEFITYQRGGVDLSPAMFHRCRVRFEGSRLHMTLAEDTTTVGGSGPWRRIVMRTKDGHQTPILTSLPARVAAGRVACLMFARWRQENLFRYLRQHQGLDTLVSHGWRDAGEQLIPNPERKRLERELVAKRAAARQLRTELGDTVLEQERSYATVTVAREATAARLAALEREMAALQLERRIVPRTVTVAAAGRTRQVMELERKHLVDAIKVAAYNAEDWLLDRLTPHYRNPFDVRDLLRSFAELSGSIATTHDAVVVTLDPPDTPAHRTALRGLCADLNALGATFPGTTLPVRYAVRVHHSERAA